MSPVDFHAENDQNSGSVTFSVESFVSEANKGNKRDFLVPVLQISNCFPISDKDRHDEKERKAIMKALRTHMVTTYLDAIFPLVSIIRIVKIRQLLFTTLLTTLRVWFPLIVVAHNFRNIKGMWSRFWCKRTSQVEPVQ